MSFGKIVSESRRDDDIALRLRSSNKLKTADFGFSRYRRSHATNTEHVSHGQRRSWFTRPRSNRSHRSQVQSEIQTMVEDESAKSIQVRVPGTTEIIRQPTEDETSNSWRNRSNQNALYTQMGAKQHRGTAKEYVDIFYILITWQIEKINEKVEQISKENILQYVLERLDNEAKHRKQDIAQISTGIGRMEKAIEKARNDLKKEAVGFSKRNAAREDTTSDGATSTEEWSEVLSKKKRRAPRTFAQMVKSEIKRNVPTTGRVRS
ncbi:unnamed protein product [Nesidiocoris tenuis]|uniref:Uncharacterized protein n=1 Tax=Nesidiocoris tenuis TaxID=355587 RepID=A0A6H5GSD3_9HEMI|nr:unnamed protein product [Nesidiocoris tenuis]